jgi:hypothetical protein
VEPIPYWILILNPLAWFVAIAASMFRLAHLEGWRWHRCMTMLLIGSALLLGEAVIDRIAAHAHRPAPHLGMWFLALPLLSMIFCAVRLPFIAASARARPSRSGELWLASGADLQEKTAVLAPGMVTAFGLASSRSPDPIPMIYGALFVALLIIVMALTPQRSFGNAPWDRKAAPR